jgi:hypothetical protein
MDRSQPPLCPRCRRTKVKLNKTPDESARPGPAVPLAVRAGSWLLGTVVHSSPHEWKCESCHHEFSRTAEGCFRCTAAPAQKQTTCCKTRLCETCVRERLNSGAECEFCG